MKSFRNWIGKLFHPKARIMTRDDRYLPDLFWYDGYYADFYNDEIERRERGEREKHEREWF